MARLSVHLTARGGRDAIDGWDGDVLRVRVSAAPVDGKANDALLRLLAKSLGVPGSRVVLLSGTSSRTKLVEIEGMPVDEVRATLGR